MFITRLYRLFYSNGLAIWHGFPAITYIIEVNNGQKPAISNFIELKFPRAYPPPKPTHFVLYSNGLDSWHGFPNITHIKKPIACHFRRSDLIFA